MTTLYVLPEADTHCFDEDTKTDCWSFSREVMVQEITKAELRGRDELVQAVRKVHAAKGRYHSQIAMCDLYNMCVLPHERPMK